MQLAARSCTGLPDLKKHPHTPQIACHVLQYTKSRAAKFTETKINRKISPLLFFARSDDVRPSIPKPWQRSRITRKGNRAVSLMSGLVRHLAGFWQALPGKQNIFAGVLVQEFKSCSWNPAVCRWNMINTSDQ